MSAQRLREAIRAHAHEQAQTARNVLQVADVVDVDPLVIELQEADITIHDPEMTQWVKWYDARNVIDVDDEVIVTRRGERWLVTDVLATKDPH